MGLPTDEMFLYEKVDLDALQIIRDNFDVFYDNGKLGRFVDAKNGYSVIQDKKIVYEMLNDFFKTRRRTEKQLYKYASGIKWGRMFSNGTSLQGISRVIRQTISKDLYWDIDISNAHPAILFQYCLNNNLKVPTLKKYIEKREELLNDLIGLVDDKSGKSLSRDDAKTIPLAIINGAKRSNWFEVVPDWVSLLEHEVKDIFHHFKETPKGKKFFKRASDKKDRNVEGSTLNYFLCEQENEILCCMIEYLRSRGIEIGVYCFDGMMVRKKEGEKAFPKKYLLGLEEQVKEELGYNLKILVKPMTEWISLDGYEKRDEPVFRMTHRACADVFYDTEGKDKFIFTPQSGWYKMDNNGEYIKTSIEDKLYLNIQNTLITVMTKMCDDVNQNVDDKEGKRNTAKLENLENLTWTENVEHTLRQKYKRDEIFEPNTSRITDDTFNLFNGFVGSKTPIEYKDEYVNPFVEHINYICGESSKYVMDWISQIIQKPWEKVGISIVITSRFQGNGKDTIAEMITRIIGDGYALKPDNLGDALFGKFNGDLRHKFFCHLPEVKGSDIKPYWNRFKEFIVSKKDGTQFKGLDRVETKSYVRYFITSNDDNPVPVEPSDRRFNYINTEAEPKDKQYYDTLYDLLDTEEAVRCLYKFFYERDISSVDWKKDRVQSDLVNDLKLSSTPLSTIFLGEFFENELLDSKNRISSNDLWSAFINFCSKSNITSKMSKISFCMVMAKHSCRYGMEKELYEVDKKTTNGYMIDLVKMETELIKDGVLKKEHQDEIKRLSLLRTQKE